MRRMLGLVALVCAINASAATYYVSASAGSDANSGSSTATAWKTLGKVNTSTFAPGDTIYLKRGDVWNEALIPPSSGGAGNLIAFDAYPVGSSGPAPRITGLLPLTNWTNVSGNLWRSTLSSGNACSSYYAHVVFNGVVGLKQSGSGAVTHDRDFYTDCSFVYVYATSNPGSYYAGIIGIISPSGSAAALIDTNGKSHLLFQHIQLDYFDTYGAYVSGASSDIQFANMSAMGYVTGAQWSSAAGKLPNGFQVSTTVATAVTFANVEGLFGNRSGEEKKESAISFVGAALQLTEAVANREIVDEAKFKQGLSKLIDGTVDCLNASSWARAK